MDKINEFKWKVNVKGYKKNDQKVLIDIRQQLDTFIDEYNEIQRQTEKEKFVVDKSKDYPPSGTHHGFPIGIPNFKCLYDQTHPDNRIPNMIQLIINSDGQITGILEKDKDSPQAREFFQFLHKNFTEYQPIC